MRHFLLLLVLLVFTGCASSRSNAKQWANVWHLADAIDIGADPQSMTMTLKLIATKGAKLEGFSIQGAPSYEDTLKAYKEHFGITTQETGNK